VTNPSIHGVIPYLVSPVGPDGRVLEAPLGRLIDDLVEAGVHGLTPLGSSGEFAYLDAEQREAVVAASIAAAAGRVPVLPGVAAAATFDAAQQARRYADLGADGLVLTMTPYFPPTNDALVRFFVDVAAVVDLPIVIYTNPQFQGYAIPPEAIERILAEAPSVRYLKDASGNTAHLQTLRRLFGDRLGLFAASAHLPVPVLQLGGLGIMSGPACLLPRPLIELYEHARAGRTTEALALQASLSALNDLFLRFQLASCVKAGLEHLGYAVGDPVPPQAPLNAAQRAELAAVLDRLGAVAASPSGNGT